MNEPVLSVIIPVFNEQHRLPAALPRLTDYFSAFPYSYEIIFVDDGSTDETCAILQDYATALPHRVESYMPNRGKGFAIRAGMAAARGAYWLFMDCDLSTSLEHVIPFLAEGRGGKQIVIGTRKISGAVIERRQHIIRQRAGEVFTWLSRRLLRSEVSDFTCGFKLFSRQAGSAIFPRMRIDRWGFDAEIIYVASLLGYHITEMPVAWYNDNATKVHMVRDAIRALVDLVRIRAYATRGAYTLGCTVPVN